MTTKLKVLILGLVVALGLWKTYSLGAYYKDLEWQTKWSEHLVEDSNNARNAESQRARREQAFNVVREEQEQAYVVGVSDLRNRVDDLSRHNDGLQQQLEVTRKQLRTAQQAARDASVNATATQTAMVLSELLGKATTELARVSATADEWYLNAAQCHKFYDEIKAR